MTAIPFNKPHLGGKEFWYIAQAHAHSQLAGDGRFTRQCQGWLAAQPLFIIAVCHPYP